MPALPPFPSDSTGFGPCGPWDPIYCTPLPTGSEEISGFALQMATEILWAKSGMRFDACTFTIRPCRTSCWGGGFPYSGWWEMTSTYPQPALIAGNWYNLVCGTCGDDCSCTPVEQIILPGPVTSIDRVTVDGMTLLSSQYRLDDWRKLVRIDGGRWPDCNDLNLADTEVGTWSVQLTYGQPVPIAGRMAVGELAHQLVLACMGDDCCILPYRIAQLARQGVTISFPDIDSLIAGNRLGLQFADTFLDAYNPYGLRSPSQVYAIDGHRPTITGA